MVYTLVFNLIIIVTYYTKNNCDNSNFTVPFTIDNLDCNKRCYGGTFLDFDMTNNTQHCSECPKNTYSTGGAFRIFGKYLEWNNESFYFLNNNCYLVNLFGEAVNSNCSAYSISKDQSFIITGQPDLKDFNYNADLSFGINLVRDGYVSLR